MDVARILAHPTVAHLLRMNARFTNRMGMQFAGAVTYFSVLAMVPILMFAFAVAGMTLTEFRPDLLDTLKESVTGLLSGASEDITAKVSDVIDEAAGNWAGIGLFGLASLAYAGSGWVGNLKSAVRAQFRPGFDQAEEQGNIVVETLKNLGILVLLLLAVGLTFGIASAATSMTGLVVRWLGVEGVPGIGILTRVVSLLISLLTGWLLFLFLYRILPKAKPRGRALFIGALAGAVGLVVLQYLTGLLVAAFFGNPATAIFGPVVVLMLFFNLFARLILLVAAWIATANQPAVAHKWTDADLPLVERDGVVVVDGHWPAATEDRRRQRVEKADAKLGRVETLNKVKDALPGLRPDAAKEKAAMAEAVETRLEVTEERRTANRECDTPGVPTRRVDARRSQWQAPGTLTGYVSGVVTGTGIGAALAAAASMIVNAITRRRRR